MLTISRNSKEELLYIYYENVGDAQKEIEKFAHENANIILDKVGMCNDEFDYFQYAVDIMVQLIEEKAPDMLNKADDFKLLCVEYTNCGGYFNEEIEQRRNIRIGGKNKKRGRY